MDPKQSYSDPGSQIGSDSDPFRFESNLLGFGIEPNLMSGKSNRKKCSDKKSVRHWKSGLNELALFTST